jgi:HSP20 family protein
MAERREWDPLAELRGVQKRLNALFESTLSHAEFDSPGEIDRWSPTCDAWQGEREVVVSVELPGVPRSSIELRLEGGELLIEGLRDMVREGDDERYHRVERAYGRFARRLRLPGPVDAENVTARLDHGVLRVTLPMRPGGSMGSRRVAIG